MKKTEWSIPAEPFSDLPGGRRLEEAFTDIPCTQLLYLFLDLAI